MPLYLLPISHIAGESRRRVVAEMNRLAPDIVAVELDPRRLQALLDRRRRKYFDIRHPKESLLAGALTLVQALFAKKVGEVAGEEFIVAVRAAAERGLPIALIDQDIGTTVSRLSKEVGLRTIAKLIWLSFFGRKTRIEFDLARVPSEKTIRAVLAEMRREFPGIYKAAVSERDKAMAAALAGAPPDKTILAIVGAAHVPGMRAILKRKKLDVQIL